MKHPEKIEKYDGALTQLAEDLGNLRYDALADFLRDLSKKIKADGKQDEARGRTQLANSLFNCAQVLDEGAKAIDKAWKISEPYMSNNKKTS